MILFLNKTKLNRLTQKKDIFCCFIYIQKAFDCKNRALLIYNLLKYNINVNIYLGVSADDIIVSISFADDLVIIVESEKNYNLW